MLRVNTTVLTAVNASDEAIARTTAPNVSVVQPDADAEALDRARTAWASAQGAGRRFFLHDADPLVAVADAWARHFEGRGAGGELELVRRETIARWRTGSIALPDFYLVSTPEDLSPTMRHWYLGVLTAAAPQRVIPVDPDRSLLDHIATLPSGRWWPPLDRLLDGIEAIVPDLGPAVDAPADEAGPALLT